MKNTLMKLLRHGALALTLALTFAAALGGNARAAAADAAQFAKVGSAAVLRQGDLVTGAMPAGETLHVVVALKVRNKAALDSFVSTAIASPPAARRTMSADQLLSQHLPTAEQSGAVAAFLANAGFTNVEVAPNGMLVSADGTAAVVQAAFHTALARAQNAGGEAGYVNVGDVVIPAALQDSVLSVIGLQTIHNPRTLVRTPPAAANAAATALRAYNPVEFSTIYGADASVPTAAGVSVGIITEGSLTQTIADLNTFTSANGLAPVNTQIVNVGGTSNDTFNILEWNLDSQAVVGMSGGQVGKLIFYNMPILLFSNLTATINAAVQANATKIVNISLGLCEAAVGNDTIAAEDQLFQIGMAQGQTFSVASGDSGADACDDGHDRPIYPGSSPYVLSVGGTTLTTNGSAYLGETVWAGGGGSLSSIEPRQSWQAGVNASAFRGVPDIAFDADPSSGANVIVRGAPQQVGGTSLAAPIFAGAWARILATHPDIGFAAPRIYNNLSAVDFHDVTSGNNGGSPATVGWDLATGFGSLILSKVNQHIGGAPVITSPATARGTVGQAFAFQLTASQPATFGVSGLPPGLTLAAATGAISGTPAAAGSFNAAVTATNTGGASGSGTLAFTILAAPVITSAGPASGSVGSVFSFQLTANQPVTFGASGLPPGLALNGATGVIAGTPAAAGSFNVTATATNVTGASASRVIVVNIGTLPRPIITSSTADVCITVAQPYSYTITADRAATFSVSGLPSGLGQNPNNVITGSPKVTGDFTVVLTASNASGSNSLPMRMSVKAIGDSCDIISQPPSS